MSRARFTRRIGLALATALALSVGVLAAAPALAPTVEQKIVAPDGAAAALFGAAVAVDGTTLVVGAPFTNGATGAVYVFERSGDSWVHAATLTASDAAPSDRLGSSVAVEGETIVAGAWGASAGLGSVYTFDRTGPAVRNETAELTASDGAVADRLGFSVAVDGDTIVAGAYLDDFGANSSQGSVYTFASTGPAARTETAKLAASDGADGDRLGWSVAVDGDTIVAGASGDGSLQGSVYTFARTGAADRIETAKLTASDGAANDSLGVSVAVEADTIVAGAPHDGTPSDAFLGAVYTFARAGTAVRTETAKLTASDGAASDRLGWSVAVEADTIVAGARDDDIGSNSDQGSVYTFARIGAATRTETGALTDPDGADGDLLGLSVAVDGDVIVAGAPEDDVGTNPNQGSASVFFAPAPVPVPDTTAPDTTAPDTTGLKGPKKVVQGKVAKFRFSSSEPGSTFRCRVDKKRWKDCAAPYKVRTSKLKVGKHTVRVVAIDASGNVDPSPAKKTFWVVPKD